MVAFTSFAFKAAGAPTSRTMPARLSEVKNVLDFGAVGNGIADDRAAIQAAIDWTDGPDRGVIYFPPAPGGSVYGVGSPGLSLNYDGPLSITFKGVGLGSRVAAGFNGFLFSRSLATASNEAEVLFDNMHMSNVGRVSNPAVAGDGLGGVCRIGSAKKVAFRDCQINGHFCYTPENTDGGLASTGTLFSSCILAGGGATIGSVGIVIAGGCIEGTDVRSFDVGYRIAGSGTTIWGGRTERCNTAMEFGVGNISSPRAASADIGAQGVAIIGHTYEGHWFGIHFAGTTKGFFAGGLYMLGHAMENSGVTSFIDGNQIGIWIPPDKLKGALFSGVSVGNVHEIAGIKLEDPTSRTFITFQNILNSVTGGGAPYDISNLAMAARYINCSGIGTNMIYQFADLPGVEDRIEGDEYDISDSTTAVWGEIATGGGTNHVRVRFNGTPGNWTVMGK